MAKGRPRAIEKSIQNPCFSSPSLPQAPVFYPTEEEFKDPLTFIAKIRPQAEPFGICRVVPPKSWAPPFALNSENFTFPTKTQSIHRLLARPPSCDSKTFELEYGRFVANHLGKKVKKKVIFEGEELDLCRVFNAVKRYGGYDKVCEGKKWGDVARFVKPNGKVSECAKHVLCQLYREHLYEYEEFRSRKCKRERGESGGCDKKGSKKRRKGGLNVERVKEEVKAEFDQICEQCQSGLHGEVMLLCDRCDKGWHLYCLMPPLESVPSGNWYCLECVNSDKDSFGFVPGKNCSLDIFRRRNDRAKRKWLGQTCTTRVQIEKRFWEIVEGKGGEVEVMYGSDLDTSVYGSGFPRIDDVIPSSIDPDMWREYCSSPWNLNNLPKLPGSMLRAVHDNIAGVMVPWLYVGMLFSSFCWHVEDHCFYSINYLHWGEPKCWYGVPGIEASAFEQVMRTNLPDLFDAQPDLLFQLVTMLNPSVLQENGVSVYNVLQEPGNFVVTFPKSFHGGFNFGLNCAEAVNFAPADWLPHGGFGAEWYRLYHKAAVLSHEELLCVVSKNGCDDKALPYLKEEMDRIFKREKKCREELWKKGVVRSSRMLPRKHPMYVGTEEDPTCIICQQYLYLSAITCTCRPSAFVCLEHWRHLCECNPSKHCLHYRQTLAELNDLVQGRSHMSDAASPAEYDDSRNSEHQLHGSGTLTKKVKGGHISYAQLAEDWLSNSCHLFEISFSKSAYKKALKDAEQFLWADHDMDTVRDMASRLMEAQKWAVNARNINSQLDGCLHYQDNHMKKVSLSDIEELLTVHPLPCCEPGLAKLKAYEQDAGTLICEIKSALLSRLEIGKLEALYSRAIEFPIKLEVTRELESEISSAKAWIGDASRCLSKEHSVNIDFLRRVKSKMADLRVWLPDMDSISNLCSEVDSWHIQCKELLNGSIKLKDLEDFLQDAGKVRVSIPELELLRQCHADACSWIFHLNDVLPNLNEREDPHNVVGELNCILEAGKSLRVQVDEIPIIEVELKKFNCREHAFKALAIHVPLNQLQHLLVEASLYGIEGEKLFVDISRIVAAAISWEERAKFVLECVAPISEFEDVVRDSENIFVILPSLPDVKDAVSLAQSWICKSQPYLTAHGDSTSPLLNVDDMKELVTQSKQLKVTLEEAERLQCILNDVNRWEDRAHTLLEHSKTMLHTHDSDIIIDSFFPGKVEELLNKIDSTIKTGQSLGLELIELPELQHASFMLHWILKALSFCSKIPLYEEVNCLLEDACCLPSTFSGNNLAEVLTRGSNWLRKAIILFSGPQRSKRCKLQDVEEILEENKKILIPYPMMVAHLQNAIGKHESWVEEVHGFFSPLSEQSWVLLLKLKDVGQSDAFDCPELDKVAHEIGKVDNWLLQCNKIVDPLVGGLGSLCSKLAKIRDTLDKALFIYRGSRGSRRAFCVCCPNDSQADAYMCLTCEDWYHFSCMGPPLAAAGMANEYACQFCLCVESGAITGPAGNALISRGNRPEMKSFVELLSVAESFCEGVQEIALAKDIVKLGLECKSYLTEIVNHSLTHRDKDLSFVSESLQRALKAVAVAGVFDVQDGCILDSAISKNAWKVRVKKLLKGPKKPSFQHVQSLLKEGLALGIDPTDNFMQQIMEVKQISLKWVDIAKKVASDSGKLELSEVFRHISEGESLPVHFEKEMKSLRDRSILYCICRKPYDQKAMIACDQCDEWYHFDCINVHEPPPRKFFCPACKPSNGEFITLPPSIRHEERCNADGAPNTPPACSAESKRRRPKKARCSLQQKLVESAVDLSSILKSHSEIDYLWRENRRPLKRKVRRPSNSESLSQILHFLQSN